MTATTKRKAAGRKPAAARKAAAKRAASGQTNGQVVHAATTFDEAYGQPPEEYIYRDETTAEVEPTLKVEPEPEPAHPYGERRIQVFEPKEGAPIIVPHISTVDVTEEFLWSNHRQGLDLMHQSWAWMDLAGIPEEIQRQVVRLGSDDKRRFWAEWFAGFVPPPTGEPPGES